VRARETLDRYRADPVAFCREVLGFDPWSGQRRILEALRDNERTAVKAANATGKTAAGAVAVPWWLAGGPGSVVVTTATTERQVKRILWREVRARMRARPAREFFRGAVVTGTELHLADDWYAVGLSTDEVEAFQGFHGARVLVIVDEASGVDEAIFDAIEGVLAGGDARLLLLGNALRVQGTFYDAFTRDRDDYCLLTLSALDTPNLTGEEVSGEARRKLVSRRFVERLAHRGTDRNEYRVRVLGEFPSQATEDQVVALGDLERAREQRFELGSPVVIGVDVARFGSDRTVLAVRRGNVVRVARAYQGKDLMRTAGEVTRLARSLQLETGRRPVIVVDDAGLGGGVTDRLRELSEFKVVPFNAARRSGSRDYPNRRSELWFLTADLLPVLDLDPADDELARDLLAPTYSLTSDGQRAVEPKANTKKRLRRSPDRADAVNLTLAVDPPRRPGEPARRRSKTSNPNRTGVRILVWSGAGSGGVPARLGPGRRVGGLPDPSVTAARVRGMRPAGRLPALSRVDPDAELAARIGVGLHDGRAELARLFSRGTS
jgi:phage terminase large subunit